MTTLLATFWLADWRCGIPVTGVQEVMNDQVRTPVPGAPPAVAGLINLRGQVVTAFDLRRCIGIAPATGPSMNVVVRHGGEVWSLQVDRIGDVVEVGEAQFEPPPDTLRGPVRDLIRGAYKLEPDLLLELDVARVIGTLAVRPPALAG